MDTILELEVGPGTTAGEFTVHVARSVAGAPATETFSLDVDALLATRQQLESVVLASSVTARRVLPASEVTVQATGARLFDALFVGAVASAYRESRAVASDRGSGLQLRLRLGAPGLAALPWEMLYDHENGIYLCRQEPLVRQVGGDQGAAVLPVELPLQVLAVVASPHGLTPLDVDAERAHLEEALEHHVQSGRVRLEWVAEATWEALHSRLLEQSWHVLHFVGHGSFDEAADEGVLALVGQDGRADLTSASSLADLLHEASPTPRLVVLNSCESGASSSDDPFSGTAAALARSGIRSVAAMQFTITDRAALAFARAFYTALANGRSVDEAMRSGRIGILGLGRGTLEWVTPVLYVRGPDTRLFDVAATPRPEHHASPTPPTPPTSPTSPTRTEPAGPAAPIEPTRAAETVPASATPTEARATVVGPPPRRRARRVLLVTVAALALVLAAVGTVVYRSMAPPSPVELQVPGNTRWMGTGVWCEPGTTIDIAAWGTIKHDQSAGGTVGPDGLTDERFHRYNVPGLPDANTAGLIGSVEEKEPFFVGTGTTYDCPRSGQLDLGINDINLEQNSGALTVRIVPRPA